MTDTVKLYHTPVTSMAVRLRGQRAVVTDCGEYNGADIVALSQEEGAEVVASHEDLTEPGAAEAFMRRADRVDILTANLARPFSFRPAVEQGDDEMQRLMEATFCPLHRLVCAVTPQMLERKRGKIVAFGNTEGIKGSRRRGCALRRRARRTTRIYGQHPKGPAVRNQDFRHLLEQARSGEDDIVATADRISRSGSRTGS